MKIEAGIQNNFLADNFPIVAYQAVILGILFFGNLLRTRRPIVRMMTRLAMKAASPIEACPDDTISANVDVRVDYCGSEKTA
jgi:hypothetical protein